MLLASGMLVGGRFVVESRAGAGGMAVVYRARDRESGQLVALKVLISCDEREAERFEREARLLSEMSHPAIVAHVAHGTMEGGARYLAMEWLTGCDLSQRLYRGPLSLEDSITLLNKASRALSIAHRRGIVHRDIKPSNLFLRGEQVSETVLLDFGIARRDATVLRLTQQGALIGTPSYMAPEQARGESDVGPAADIFSLGCVFFECLSGRPPFEGAHVMAVLAKILFEPSPRLSERVPTAGATLSLLCERMLEKDPSERIQDADALLSALSGADLQGAPLSGESLSRSAPRLTTHEHEVVSVIVAQHGEHKLTGTESTEELVAATASLSSLSLDAHTLADGTVVSVVSGLGQATDQVAHAARAALLLHERIPNAKVALATGRARAGIQGQLPVGEVIDRVFSQVERAIPGEGVFIDETTDALLSNRFHTDTLDRGARVVRAERAVADESRLLLGRPTPCVGRERELGELQSLFEYVRDEPIAQAMLVVAPAGTGKSRLRYEFLRRLSAEKQDFTLILGRGDPVATTLGLVPRALRDLLGIEGHQELSISREKVERYVRSRGLSGDVPRHVEFLGELVGVPFPDEKSPQLRTARQDPRFLNERMTSSFVALVRALSQSDGSHGAPLLIVLEDLHWSDSLSVALIDSALRQLVDHPIMVLSLARPEVHEIYPKLWVKHLEIITLRPLRARASKQLARELLGDSADAGTVRRIVEQSGGNALFLEELIRAVAEGRGDALPETVLAILQVRLGALPPDERQALRAASIFGASCTVSGVSALVGPAPVVERSLSGLVEKEVLERRCSEAVDSMPIYGFRHALARDAAYSMLVEEDRKLGHVLAAEWLEAQGDADPRVLAKHFHSGGALGRAVPYCLRATLAYYRRGDFKEAERFIRLGEQCGAEGQTLGTLICTKAAITHMEIGPGAAIVEAVRGAALLTPESPWWWRIMGQLCVARLIMGQRDEGVSTARALLDAEPPSTVAFEYLTGMWIMVDILSQIGLRDLATRGLARIRSAVVDDAADNLLLRIWIRTLGYGYSRHTRPDPWAQLGCIEEAIRVFRELGGGRFAELAVMVHNAATTYAELGDHARSEAMFRESIETLRSLNISYAAIHGLIHFADALSCRSENLPVAEIEALARQLLGTALTPGFAAWTHCILGAALLERGDLEGAEAEVRKAMGGPALYPFRRLKIQAVFIRVLLRANKLDEACAAANEAIQKVESLGDAAYAEIAIRTAVAMAFHASGDLEKARKHLRVALSEIDRQAAAIPAEAQQERFRRDVADNVRALNLARVLQLDFGPNGACSG